MSTLLETFTREEEKYNTIVDSFAEVLRIEESLFTESPTVINSKLYKITRAYIDLKENVKTLKQQIQNLQINIDNQESCSNEDNVISKMCRSLIARIESDLKKYELHATTNKVFTYLHNKRNLLKNNKLTMDDLKSQEFELISYQTCILELEQGNNELQLSQDDVLSQRRKIIYVMYVKCMDILRQRLGSEASASKTIRKFVKLAGLREKGQNRHSKRSGWCVWRLINSLELHDLAVLFVILLLPGIAIFNKILSYVENRIFPKGMLASKQKF